LNYTKDKLLKVARHWEGLSLNDRLANKNPTPMITIEIPVAVWDRIWEEDAAPDMYEALNDIIAECPTPTSGYGIAVVEIAKKALAKAEGKENDGN